MDSYDKEKKCIGTFRESETTADWCVVTTHIPAAGAAAGAVRLVGRMEDEMDVAIGMKNSQFGPEGRGNMRK